MSNSTSKNPFAFWKIDPEEFKEQIEKYDKLPFSKSSHKICAAIFVVCGSLTAIATYFDLLHSFSFIDAVIMVGLSWFMYDGKKWSFMAGMIFWTFAKIQMLATGANPATQVIFWFIFMKPLFLSYKVAKARMEPQQPNPGSSTAA